MKIHLRFDNNNDVHSHSSLFINGAFVGSVCASPAETIWLNHILQKGCEALSPIGSLPIEFVSSGNPPDPPQDLIDAAVQ